MSHMSQKTSEVPQTAGKESRSTPVLPESELSLSKSGDLNLNSSNKHPALSPSSQGRDTPQNKESKKDVIISQKDIGLRTEKPIVKEGQVQNKEQEKYDAERDKTEERKDLCPKSQQPVQMDQKEGTSTETKEMKLKSDKDKSTAASKEPPLTSNDTSRINTQQPFFLPETSFSASLTDKIEETRDNNDQYWKGILVREFNKKMAKFRTKRLKRKRIYHYSFKAGIEFQKGRVTKVNPERGNWSARTLKKLKELYPDKYKYIDSKMTIIGNYDTSHIVACQLMETVFESSVQNKTRQELMDVFKLGFIFLMKDQEHYDNVFRLLSQDTISDDQIELMSIVFLADQNHYPSNLYPGDRHQNRSEGGQTKKCDFDAIFGNKKGPELRQLIRDRLIDFRKQEVNKAQHEDAEQFVKIYVELFARAWECKQQSKPFNLPLELYKLKNEHEDPKNFPSSSFYKFGFF